MSPVAIASGGREGTARGRKEESDRNELTNAEFFIAELASQRLLKRNLLELRSVRELSHRPAVETFVPRAS